MIPGGSLCVFCIGMGYTGEKLTKKGSKNMQKLEENDSFFMNGSFRGAFELKLGPGGQKNISYAEMMSDFSQISIFGLF